MQSLRGLPKKLNSEPSAGMCAFNQAGNIGDNECLVRVDRDHPELRFERREGIIGNLRARGRYARDQCRLADVGKTDQTHIRQKLQFESKIFFVAQSAVLSFVRSTIHG